ncbi:MAG TPA: SHOCT domain-containing protein [Thermomicrobiales bacterium]|nr:SHOCT domain-containing protein [Thermomicrobiales bacterium]
MFRGPIIRPGPGLVRTVAATAVISGAVHGSQHAARHEATARAAMAAQAAGRSRQQISELRAQLAALQAQQLRAAVPVSARASGGADIVIRLQELARMQARGTLTEQEFQAAKASLLGIAQVGQGGTGA